jgi:hypothetical protein
LSYARDVAAWVTEASDEAEPEGITARFKDNRNGCGFCLCRKRRRSAGCSNDRNLMMNKLGHKPGEPISSTVCPTIFNRDVLTFNVAHFLQAATEGSHHGLVAIGRRHIKKADQRHRPLLRIRDQRARKRHTAQTHTDDEFASSHGPPSGA